MNALPPLFIYAFLMSAIVYCLCAEMSVILSAWMYEDCTEISFVANQSVLHGT